MANTRAPGDFNRATRQSILTQPTMTLSDSGVFLQDLPQTGYGAGIWLLLTGTTNTAAASSTTAANTVFPPPPFNYITRIVLRNNQGVDLFNISGWGLYLYNATLRTGFDQAVDHSDFIGGFTSPFTRYFAGVSSLGASASETWKCAWYLPITWGFNLQAGLQLWQDPGVRYTLEITTGTVASLYSATTGTVTSSAVSLAVEPEIYHLPADPNDQPALSYTKTVLEDITSISATGDFTYTVTTGNMYTRVIQEFANGATLQPFAPANITNLRIRYSQTQQPYNMSGDLHLFRQRMRYDRDLPPGVYVHELAMPNGLPEILGSRDIINTAKLTDAQIVSTIATGVSTTNARCRTIREQLVANR